MTELNPDTKNVYLIMPDDMVKKYRRRFLKEGFICKAVDSGFYALTMLEREKPSLIIATEDIEDLEIYDLLEIIDSDPDLSETHIIVLSENLEPHANRRCMTLSRDSDFEAILATAYQLLTIDVEATEDMIPVDATDSVSLFNVGDDSSDQVDEKQTNNIILDDTRVNDSGLDVFKQQPNTLSAINSIEDQLGTDNFDSLDTFEDDPISRHRPADVRYDTSDAQITGELATDQLLELIKTFAMGARGLLIVRTAKADGRLLLEHDRLLKAEYNNIAGQDAFNALISNALSEDRVSYFFKRYDNTTVGKASQGKGVALSYLMKVFGQLTAS